MQLSLNLPICIQSGDCGLCDILTFTGSVFELLIVLLAAGAFIMLLVGSIYFVLSRGNPETRKKGINILTSVTAGVFIGLLAWQIVNLTIFILIGNNKFDETGQPVKYKVFGNPWNEVCGSESFRYPGGCLDNNNNPKPDKTNCGIEGECQNGVCIGSKTELAELAECLGKSNGSPCANGAKHCVNGSCIDGDSCKYLATEAKYAGKFNNRPLPAASQTIVLHQYECVSVSKDTNTGNQIITDQPNGWNGDKDKGYPTKKDNVSITLDCMDSLCPDNQLCCGEVAGN